MMEFPIGDVDTRLRLVPERFASFSERYFYRMGHNGRISSVKLLFSNLNSREDQGDRDKLNLGLSTCLR